jgi:hypothetical protein
MESMKTMKKRKDETMETRKRLMETWKQLIEIAMREHSESWNDVESCTLTEEELNVPFDIGYGQSEGSPFTLWTKSRVYFPAVYDGAE